MGAKGGAVPRRNIAGRVVSLGPLRRDLVPLYQRWINDFGTQSTLGGPPVPRTVEQELERYRQLTAAEDSAQFTIYERATDRPIGITELQEIDRRNRTATFVIFIGEADARGRGYGTEATRLVLDYAFTTLGLHNVILTVVAFNAAAIRAYERAGFRASGRRRECRLVGGRRWDDIYMECLASEFVGPMVGGAAFAPNMPRGGAAGGEEG
jgi:RimJ/RimL family protein N-acetyltransferase